MAHIFQPYRLARSVFPGEDAFSRSREGGQMCADDVLHRLWDYGNRKYGSMPGCLHPHLPESNSCPWLAADAREHSTMVAALLLTAVGRLIQAKSKPGTDPKN
jgi:hypothetical protein